MFSTPNMKDVHYRNLSFWSPQPLFIAGFFLPQQLFQLAWLYRLYKLDSKNPGERKELDTIVDFVPYYSIGNLCIGSRSHLVPRIAYDAPIDIFPAWMIFWNTEHLKIANIFVVINSLTQLYYVFAKLEPMNTRSTTSVLTNIVSKTFAGIGVLDLLHNGSVAYFKDVPATVTVKVVTGLGFALASAASDWIFGGCMVYDLVALAAGQSGSWRNLLAIYAVGAAGIVGAKNIAR